MLLGIERAPLGDKERKELTASMARPEILTRLLKRIDVARANVCALKSDTPFGFYNVGRGIKTSIKELTEIVLKITGSHQPIKYEPAGQTFVTNRVGDPTAAERDLGFRWTVDLEEGLEKLIAWRHSHKAKTVRNKITLLIKPDKIPVT